MKKTILILMAMILCLAMAGCQHENTKTTTAVTTGETTTYAVVITGEADYSKYPSGSVVYMTGDSVNEITTINSTLDKEIKTTYLNSIKNAMKDENTIALSIDNIKVYKWFELSQYATYVFSQSQAMAYMDKEQADEYKQNLESFDEYAEQFKKNAVIDAEIDKMGMKLSSAQKNTIDTQVKNNVSNMKNSDSEVFADLLAAYGMTYDEYLNEMQLTLEEDGQLRLLYKEKVCPAASYSSVEEQDTAFDKHIDELMKKYDVKTN